MENVGREWSQNLDFRGKKWKDLGRGGVIRSAMGYVETRLIASLHNP